MRFIAILLISAGSLAMLSAQTPTFFKPESLGFPNFVIRKALQKVSAIAVSFIERYGPNMHTVLF